MAQIIKHRRGLIGGVKNLTARNGELIIASGSISDLSGPFVFIGSPNAVDEGVAGAFNSVSKLYTGTAAPTITAATYGSALDGTPYYASGNKSIYILNNSNVGNTQIDLTGNIEGNTISGVTITNLQSTNVTASYVSASFVGDGSGLINIPATGITGLNLAKIYSGSVQVTTDSVSGDIHLDADNGVYISGSTLDIKADTTLTGSLFATKVEGTGSIYLQPDQDDSRYFEIYNTGLGDTHIKASGGYSFFGDDTNYLKIDDGAQTVTVNGVNGVFINTSAQIDGNTSITGALVVADGSATFDQGLVAQNSNMLLTSGSNLIVQDGGNAQVDYIRGNTNEWNYLSLDGNGVFGQPGIELSSSGDISLWAEGGHVNVTGSLNVTGDITFSGSINLGDFTGDTINFNGEVSSSILPITGAVFDLGSSGQTWNNIWAETAHFSNISLNTISFSGLTEGRVLLAGPSGSIVDSGSLTYGYDGGYGTEVLSAPIIHATNDGNGTNFKVGNDMWIGDVNEANTMRFMGADDNEVTKIYLNNSNTNNQLYANYGDVTLQSNNQLNLESQNGSVYLESFDGTIYLNDDSGNNVRMGGNAYINDNLYVNRIYDDNDNNNYLQLYGWNTDDGNWWESGNGADTTLLNNENNNNLNILQTNNGDVNIDATGGSVNIHSQNGMNITGSLTVSDASGVFNSSLIVSNSDLTLDGGSNIHMDDNAHLYFDTCVDINYDNGTGNLIFANSCNDFEFRNDVSITGSLNISGDFYTDNIYGASNNNNMLNLDGGVVGANGIELQSETQISLWAEGGDVNVTGSVHLGDNLDVTGSVTILTNLNVSGNTAITGAFTVASGSVTTLGGNLYVSGNLEVLGSATNVNIESNTVNIGDNIIQVNAYSPFDRYAGLAAYDSGSSGLSGSLLWDSVNDYWLFVSSSGQSSKVIGTTADTFGSEVSLTSGTFPIASGDNTIEDSLLTYSGTTLSFNTNKFTIDSGTGDTAISGNLTLSYSGGTDNGTATSMVMFKNSDNIVGYVDTTDTQLVTTQLLGYDETTGVLQFSSVIDGGTY